MQKLSINVPEVRVDEACMLKDVKVYNDYSTHLIRTDISYKEGLGQDKFYKMQVLERTDVKKWVLWVIQGRIH